jgi:transposase-like protein
MMKSRNEYTKDFREQALKKVYARGDRSVKSVADELQMSHKTLGNWISANKRSSVVALKDKPLSDRLQLLMGSHGLSDEALNGYCRENGIFRHQLERWQVEFERGGTSPVSASAVRELKESNRQLHRELARKEKALAEAAALLVLQKKYQSLWEEKDE